MNAAKDVDSVEDVNSIQEASVVKENAAHRLRVSRSAPPFVFSHDVPRGVTFAFQALLAYILMLSVMWVSSLSFLVYEVQIVDTGPSKQHTSFPSWWDWELEKSSSEDLELRAGTPCTRLRICYTCIVVLYAGCFAS